MPQIEPGTVVLDKYRVVRTLGIGGMGMVVHAVHTTLGNDVAIKFLLPQFSTSGDAARRFVREAQAASKIQCEHIARVSDVGSGPLGPYMVMEFLEGQDLSKQIKQFGPLPVQVALDYAVQAATALSEAHRHGIIHRDVKPANLFVVERTDGSPLVKVLDFGISKVAESSSLDVTKTTAILGSGLYMSPEQMKSSKSVDARADVYALGVTLYEMLTGTQPHVADNFPDLVMKVNMDPPDPLQRHRADVPEELARVIEKAYARKADDRYGSMLEFAQALAPWSMPETRSAIDAIARAELRAGRRGSSPSMSPPFDLAQRASTPPAASYPPGALSHADAAERPSLEVSDGARQAYSAVIPAPPSMPNPRSLGVDTFGRDRRPDGPSEPLGHTAEKNFAATKSSRSRMGLLGVGIGVGALLAAAAAGVFLWRGPWSGPASSLTASPVEGSSVPAGAPGAGSATDDATQPVVTASQADPVQSAAASASAALSSSAAAEPGASASASAAVAPSPHRPPIHVRPTPSVTASASAVVAPPASTTAAPPPPPCIPGLRTLDGKPCTP
jgi:eukaryotic-like serine/threonine-protein kinase